MDFIYVFLFLTIFVAIITLLYYKITNKALNNIRIVEIFLLSFLVISVGIGGIWAFIGHAFLPAQVAANIGWPASPFQLEVAFANLAIGVLGILCYWIRDNFWTSRLWGSPPRNRIIFENIDHLSGGNYSIGRKVDKLEVNE